MPTPRNRSSLRMSLCAFSLLWGLWGLLPWAGAHSPAPTTPDPRTSPPSVSWPCHVEGGTPGHCTLTITPRATLALCGLGLHVAEAESGQEVRFDPQTGALEEPSREVAPEGEPAPVGREAAREAVALLFDRSEGRPEGTPA